MIDHKREQEVWQRVMTMSAEAPRCDKPVGKQGLTAEQVVELLCGELEDAAVYEALACRVRGQNQQKLRYLARQELRHFAKLEAVYYLMTGKKPCPDKPKRPCIACTNEELRSRYIHEVESAAKYRCLSEKAGSFAGVFEAIGCEEERHAEEVLQILQYCL